MHHIEFGDKKLGRAIMEIAEDKYAEVLKHYDNPNTLTKKSVITLTITVEPDDGKKNFQYEVAGKVALAARKTVSGNLYTSYDSEGEKVVLEFDPDQERLPLYPTSSE